MNGVEILIVEYSATQALKLRHVLQRHEYRAAVARSGAEALAALETRPPALVLSALVMPDMDGYELCRRIKARRELAGVPVILLMPLSDPREIVDVLECGADDFIAKPYDEAFLLSRLRDIRARGATGGPSDRTRNLLLSAYEIAVRRSLAPSAPPEVAALPESFPEAGQQRRLRILMAEDSAVNQRLALHVLEKQGHTVAVSGNGREALAALEKQPFDLVLMDVEMPEMDGLEATAAIREKERAAGGHIPIIAMTAHDRAEDRERCLRAGMDGYVSKPLQVEELSAVLDGLPPAPAAALPPFDPEEALARVGGDQELLGEIVGLFFEETPALLAQMRESLAGGDAKTLERAAHSLKGSAAAFGAQPVIEAAQSLETAAEGGDLAEAERALAALEPEAARLIEALRRLRDEDGKG